MKQLSGFFFDVEAFRGSTSVRRMSFSEVGVYLMMMLEQWKSVDKSLPDSPEAVASLIAVTPAQAAEVQAAWEAVRRKFIAHKHRPGRIYNARVERTRRQQRANHLAKVFSGRSGGKATAAKRWRTQEIDGKHRSSTAQAATPPCSTDKRRGEEIRLDQIREEERSTAPPPDARSKRPIFTGQRLTVFEWQLDDCLRTLGEFADGFELHEWFYALDAQAVQAHFVIPKRDGGEWLQAQLMAEAQRRGLPLRMATVSPVAKTMEQQAADVLAEVQAHAKRVAR